MRILMTLSFITALACSLHSITSHAQTKSASETPALQQQNTQAQIDLPQLSLPSIYSPQPCEFSVAFPEEPTSEHSCDAPGNQCYERASFTQVFNLGTTVSIKATCNPINEDIRARYSEDVIKATLQAMTKDKIVETYEMNVIDQGSHIIAGLIGEGRIGLTESMYLAQIWIGEQSALSLEAEIIGDANPEADLLFQQILQSIHHKESHLNADNKSENKIADPNTQQGNKTEQSAAPE